MGALKDLTGQPFGRWTVLRRDDHATHRAAAWLCKCECGATKTVSGAILRSGESRSCGCLAKDVSSARQAASAKTWTPARRVIVFRDWPTDRPAHDILADLNAEPGPQIRLDQLSPRAAKWGLRRPDGYVPAHMANFGDHARGSSSHAGGAAVPLAPQSNSWLFAKRVVVTNAPNAADVAAWIATHGVKRLPAAAAWHTTAEIPEADRVALSEYRAERAAADAVLQAPRIASIRKSISHKQSRWVQTHRMRA